LLLYQRSFRPGGSQKLDSISHLSGNPLYDPVELVDETAAPQRLETGAPDHRNRRMPHGERC
jgi:hypothetical protein